MNRPTASVARPTRVRNVAMALAVAGITAASVVYARHLISGRGARRPARDYRWRSGFPQPPGAMRGIGRISEIPSDLRVPQPLRPWMR